MSSPFDIKLPNFNLNGNITNASPTSSRDSRRTFNRTQKNEIWAQQNGKCAGKVCNHSRLDPRTVEYDHIKPWADKGKTIVENGAALCPSCHKLKTHATRLKKVNKSKSVVYQNSNPLGLPSFKTPKFDLGI